MNNIKFPKIALGTWSWGAGITGGDQVFGNNLDTTDLEPVFDEAMKDGLTLWDSAFAYGMGASETILGNFTQKVSREDVIISTKFTPQLAENTPNPVEDMCNGSLKRFGTDYINIYWIHNPADVEKWTPLLAPLVQSGKVKYVGVSNHNLAQIKRAEEILATKGIPLSAVQNHYSLLYRSSEETGIIDYCNERGMQFFSYMVLEQGAISGKYSTENLLPANSQRGKTYNPLMPQINKLTDVTKNIAQNHAVSAAQIPLAWAIAKGTIPIIGVTKISQVKDAVQAENIQLSADEIEEIETIAKEINVDTRGSWEAPMM